MTTKSTTMSSQKKKTLLGIYLLQAYVVATDLGAMLAMPKALEQFNASDVYGILITAYVLVMAISTPIGGKLGDLFGRKKATFAGAFIFTFGTVMSGVSPNLTLYFIGFLILGIGLGLLLPLLIAMVSDATTEVEFPKYMGLYTTVNNVSMLVGPLLSGVITDVFGPKLVYVYLIPVLIYAIWVLNKNYEAEVLSDTKPVIDYLGILYLVLGAGPILLVFNLAGASFDWVSLPTIGLIVLGLIFGYVFINHELKFKEPIIDVALFKKPVVAMAFSRTVTFMAYSSIVTSYLILFAQQGLGVSATISGSLALPKTIATIILPAILGGWVAKDADRRLKMALIAAGIGVGSGCLILGLGAGTSIAVILIYIAMIFLGIGESCYFVSHLPHIKSLLPEEEVGSGIAINTFFSTFSLAIYGAVFGGVLNAFNNDIASAFPTMAYIGVFCAILFIVLSVIGVKTEKQ